MTSIGIFGAAGRMGRAIAEEIGARGLALAGGTDRAGTTDGLRDGRAIGNDPASLAATSDVLIDFSSPSALAANLDACIAAGKPVVIGTTGLEAEHHRLIDAAAQKIAVLQTGN